MTALLALLAALLVSPVRDRLNQRRLRREILAAEERFRTLELELLAAARRAEDEAAVNVHRMLVPADVYLGGGRRVDRDLVKAIRLPSNTDKRPN